MKRPQILTAQLSLIFIMCFSQLLYAKDKPQLTEKRVVEITSLLSGNDYLKMSPSSRRTYIIGVLDGIELAPTFCSPSADKLTSKDRIKWIENCVEVMSFNQLEAIVSKYLQDNPALWHMHMNMLVIKALIDAPCDKWQ